MKASCISGAVLHMLSATSSATPEKRFGIVDCNNFYASCERLFAPHLIGKPVVVLSNNDGCLRHEVA